MALTKDLTHGISDGQKALVADVLRRVGHTESAPVVTPSDAPVKRGPGRPRKDPTAPPAEPKPEKAPTVLGPNDKQCKVPNCNKKVVAKGLCQSHYRKANAQKMDLDALTTFQLETLAEDGRATRWEKVKKEGKKK